MSFLDPDTVRAMHWFNGLSSEEKIKVVLKAGGRSSVKITAYWKTLQG